MEGEQNEAKSNRVIAKHSKKPRQDKGKLNETKKNKFIVTRETSKMKKIYLFQA
jgi:hypothetical protein